MRFNADETHYKSKRLHPDLYVLQVQVSSGLPAFLQPRATHVHAPAPRSSRGAGAGAGEASGGRGAPLLSQGCLKAERRKRKRRKHCQNQAASNSRESGAKQSGLREVSFSAASEPPASCSLSRQMRAARRPQGPARARRLCARPALLALGQPRRAGV